MNALHKKIFGMRDYNNGTPTPHYTLPIKTICGLPVMCIFRKHSGYYYTFEIYQNCGLSKKGDGDDHLYYQDKMRVPDVIVGSISTFISFSGVAAFIDECLNFIKTCRFNKITAKFISPIDPDEISTEQSDIEIALFFKDTESVKIRFDECCVCYDYTGSKLNECGHPVCVECITKLEKDVCRSCNGDYNEGCKCEGTGCIWGWTQNCPMCRATIEHEWNTSD